MTEKTTWFYYNHAYLPEVQPDEIVNPTEVNSGEIWKKGHKGAVFARWTSDFDCGVETGWWYIIKDTPFDINSLKSRKRYRINQGLRTFTVRVIDPEESADELYRVQTAAYSTYPKKYRPSHPLSEMMENAKKWKDNPNVSVFGAFFNETEQLCGYAIVEKKEKCLDFNVLKADPEYEKQSLNHALIASVLNHYSDLLSEDYYICNGERNVQHETNFQKFVEENFGYRRAFCKLNIAYNPKYKPMINVLYALRGILRKIDGIRIIHKINGILKMEEIVREQEKTEKHE